MKRGDVVWTKDGGRTKIEWTGRTTALGLGACAPVVIEHGALGNAHRLVVSQEHRIFYQDQISEFLFVCPDVLIAAKHLAGLPGIAIVPQQRIEYTHFMFDWHHIVEANGLLCESFFLSELALSETRSDSRTEIISLFPEIDPKFQRFGDAVALCLKQHEVERWRHYAAAEESRTSLASQRTWLASG